jgi:hypothetical protein
MFTAVLSALGGAAGLAALLSPVLVHMSQRRGTAATERSTLVEQLQEERDTAVSERRDLAVQVAALWQAYLDLRYWIVKGSEGSPPTMPPGLTIAAVRARADA